MRAPRWPRAARISLARARFNPSGCNVSCTGGDAQSGVRGRCRDPLGRPGSHLPRALASRACVGSLAAGAGSVLTPRMASASANRRESGGRPSAASNTSSRGLFTELTGRPGRSTSRPTRRSIGAPSAASPSRTPASSWFDTAASTASPTRSAGSTTWTLGPGPEGVGGRKVSSASPASLDGGARRLGPVGRCDRPLGRCDRPLGALKAGATGRRGSPRQAAAGRGQSAPCRFPSWRRYPALVPEL